mmetsp:Transcript_8474/g.20069  ORF Transcript_8474/g.20069 Transcript_8474/m.20069 type:complete len:555 (+) Transcript_8474:88-1752(+)
MQRLHELLAKSKHQGLFKATRASSVVAELVAQRQKRQRHGFVSSRDFDALPEVERVDVFVSHSWKGSNILKALAMCHYLNLWIAVALSTGVWIATACFQVVQAGGIEAVANHCDFAALHVKLVYCPLGVFFLVYFLGHHWSDRTYWLDMLCVCQDFPQLKERTLEVLPAFVMNSSEMLVLWDESYFQRLWCNFELAVFARSSWNPQAVSFVPTWLPVWTLSSVVMDLFAVACVPYGVALALEVQQAVARQFGRDSGITQFMVIFAAWVCPLSGYLLTAIPVTILNLQKIRQHRNMLADMADFNIKSAQCSLESDREVIEAQVSDLFDEAQDVPCSVAIEAPGDLAFDEEKQMMVDRQVLEAIRPLTSYPSNDEVLDVFHAYIRGPLRDRIMDSMGAEIDVSWSLSMISFLPMAFSGLSFTLGCDGDDCQKSASRQGFSSVPQYMAFNIISCATLQLVGAPNIHPLLLRMLNMVVSHTTRTFVRVPLALVLAVLIYAFVFSWVGVWAALLKFAMTTGSRWSIAGVALNTAALSFLTWWLFFKRKHRVQSSRSLLR